MEHPKRIGDRTTLAVMAVLERLGYELYVPFGENTRTDLVIDDGYELQRVQCKTGRLRNGAVRFATCSYYGHHPNPRQPSRDYLGQIEAFAVFCPETNGVYLIPIEELQLRAEGALRVDPPRNGQRSKIRFAADYEIGNVRVQDCRSSSGPTAPSASPRMST